MQGYVHMQKKLTETAMAADFSQLQTYLFTGIGT